MIEDRVQAENVAGTAAVHAGPAVVIASAFRPTLPVVLAQATGAFRRAGLSVEVRTAASSDAQLAQLVAGEVDVAHTALDNVVAWSEHAHVRVIGVVDLGVAHELVARDPVASVADLRGSAIGVDSPRSGFVVLLEAALHDAGLDHAAYTIVPVGGLTRRADALAAGEIDACLLAGSALRSALGAGHRRLLAIREHFPRYPAIALVALAPLAAERRLLLRRYISALSTALRTADASHDAVAAVLGSDAATATSWLETERARMTGIVADAETALDVIAAALAVTGRVAPGEPIDRFVELLMEASAA